MYNSELKRKFISQYTTSENHIKVIETMFGRCEPFEEKWDADLCTRGTDDLRELLTEVSGLRAKSVEHMYIVLRDYVRWCRDVEQYPGAVDGVTLIDQAGLGKIRYQTVASPLHLQKYLDKLFRPEEEQSTDSVLRCYHWLAFSGLSEEEILAIRRGDVDLDNMIIRSKGGEYPIYREALTVVRNCAKLDAFSCPVKGGGLVLRGRVDGDTLLRGVRSDFPDVHSLRTAVCKASRAAEPETHMRLSYDRLWLSGIFYRMRERELAGEAPNFAPVAAEKIKIGVYATAGEVKAGRSARRKLARSMREDYNRWKLAHHV